MESKKLTGLINSIRAGAAKQRDQIQEACIQAALYAFADRNTDPAKRLMEAVGAGVHKASISKWLSLCAPIHFNDKGAQLSSKRQKELAGAMTVEVFEVEIRAMAPWYVMDEVNNKTPNIWDGLDILKKETAHLRRLAKKANSNGDLVCFELLVKIANDLERETASVAAIEAEEVEEAEQVDLAIQEILGKLANVPEQETAPVAAVEVE